MKLRFLTFFTLISLLMCSCEGEDDTVVLDETNKVLVLKVDYMTNTFEGGKELTFDSSTDSFTIDTEYQEPSDFGGIQVYYQELDTKIFDGTIVWNGTGAITYPEDFIPASEFEVTATLDYVFPTEGFENIFNPTNESYNYQTVWNAVQSVLKAREYINSNPDAKVSLFLYTPSVGIGNPEEWDWILILKN